MSGGGRRRQAGQATVELVGMIPLLVAVAAAAFAVLAAGRASNAADAAAGAAARAIIQGRDGEAEARRVLTGWPRGAATVRVRGGRVHVRVRPRFPLLAGLLAASAEADAGPARPEAPMFVLRGGDGLSGAPSASAAPAAAPAPAPAAPAPLPPAEAPAALALPAVGAGS